jgi:hypothetical protein
MLTTRLKPTPKSGAAEAETLAQRRRNVLVDGVDDILGKLGFSRPCFIQGRASVADLFRPKRRCGIYVLHFATGEFYAGQAIDMVRRYVQHAKTHDDIEWISFKRVRLNRLNEAEREVIWALEKSGVSLRNISLTSIPKGQSDFDLLMSVQEQERWLKDIDFVDAEGPRLSDPELRRKYRKKFEAFSRQDFSSDVIRVLRRYVSVSIPTIRRGECSFWSCSCLPAYHNRNVIIYSRINLYWQEVFTAYAHDGTLYFSAHMALSPLENALGDSLAELEHQYAGLTVEDHKYDPGGSDQVNIEVQGPGTTLKVLQDPAVIGAIRLFNLRLMKKGACMYNRNHCFDLADALLNPEQETKEPNQALQGGERPVAARG